MEEFDLLRKQFQDNAVKWYPFEDDIDYKILRKFSKDDEKQLQNIYENMKENQRIVLILENKLALKNMCEENEESEDRKNKYNKKEIEQLLDLVGLKYRKFYYLLPDIDTTNVIFTDKYIPNKESMSRNIGIFNETIIKNDEKDIYLDLIEQNRRFVFNICKCFFY